MSTKGCNKLATIFDLNKSLQDIIKEVKDKNICLFDILPVVKSDILVELMMILLKYYDHTKNLFEINGHKFAVTLQDVLYITGLPIRGTPIMNAPKDKGAFKRVFGIDKEKPGSIKGLKDLAGDTNLDPDTRLKAALMVLIACFVIPNGDDSIIKGDYVKFVEKLEDVNNYAWGAALLAYLYEGIHKWKVSDKKSGINGNLWVILAFFLIRIPRLQKAIKINFNLKEQQPLLLQVVEAVSSISYKHSLKYRNEVEEVLNNLCNDMIEWKPYKFDLHRPILADQKKYTLLLAPICCMSAVHYHTPHYVHKQFEELEAVDLNQIMWTRPSRKRKQNRGPTAQKFLSESELQQWNNGMLVTNYLQGHKDDGMVDQPHVDSLVHVDQPERDVEEDQIDSEAATGSACATEDGMVDQPERRVDNAMVDLSESMHPLLQSTTLDSDLVSPDSEFQDHEVVSMNDDDLKHREEEEKIHEVVSMNDDDLEHREDEEKRLEETLELQRRIENEAKDCQLKPVADGSDVQEHIRLPMQEQLAKENGYPSNLEVVVNTTANGSMMASKSSADFASQRINNLHQSTIKDMPNGIVPENGLPLPDRRAGIKRKRNKNSSEDEEERCQADLKKAVPQCLDTYQARGSLPLVSSLRMPQRSSLQVDCSGLAPVESSSSSSQSVAMQVETGKSYTIKPRTMALREDGDVEGPGEDRIEEQWNDSGDTYSEIPEVHTGEKIHKNGEATDDDIIHMIMKPVCSGCRINNKDNPNCFCALVPPLGGKQNSDIWQKKKSDFVESLGLDPNTKLRASDSPAGLNNLGATCYVNSILQCLYMNEHFRKGLFSVEPHVLNRHPVLNELACLFALLQSSKKASVDSSPFVKTLNLDPNDQQDSDEFLTLFLSLLASCLGSSEISKAKTIVQDLFRGSVSHVKRCSQCERTFPKMDDFYDLKLNVKGLRSLDESLDKYLQLEELNGDDQYFCKFCDTKVDATDSIELQTLPEVLVLSLKRYVFLRETSTKKKITSPFSFPAELSMHHRLSEPSQSELIYDLSAVMIHKGTEATSGHYISYIKEKKTGHWWKFDDELVTNLGHCPFAEEASCSASKSVKNDVNHCNFSGSRVADSNGNGLHVKVSKSSAIQTFSSSDSCMLMYSRKNPKIFSENWGMVSKKEDDSITAQDNDCLPSHFSERIQCWNDTYLNDCKDVELSHSSGRIEEVRSVLAEAPVQPSEEQPYFWIASDWLREWAENVTPSAIDNTSIQCLHGKVQMSKVTSMKRLSSKAWDTLLSKYGGGPALSDKDLCRHCPIAPGTYQERRKSYKQLAQDILNETSKAGKYYISKEWLQKWCRREVAAPSKDDFGPTADISCQHGQLYDGAERVLVPESFWHFLYNDSISVKNDDLLDCHTFPRDSKVCSQCNEELSMSLLKSEFRSRHDKLLSGIKSMPLSPGSTYYLVPSSWLSKWRNCIKSSESPESLNKVIGSLNQVIGSLICKEHSRLIEKPPKLTCRGRGIFQKEPSSDVLTIISENEWKDFCEEWVATKMEEWDATKIKGVSAKIEKVTKAGHCKKKAKVNNESEVLMKTSPEVCDSCLELDISVILITGNEALEASKKNIQKVSKLIGKKKPVPLKLRASTTIYRLKMCIWKFLEVVIENQILQKKSDLTTIVSNDKMATLVEANIFDGDVILVMNSKIHENRDIDIADEINIMDTQDREEGFRGTLLTSNI